MTNYDDNSAGEDYLEDDKLIEQRIGNLEKVLLYMGQQGLAYCPEWIRARDQLRELKRDYDEKY